MKLAVISDQHLGFGWGRDRAEDPFRNFEEALERAADADIILLPGDIFDGERPPQEVLARAIDCFRELEDRDQRVEVVDGEARFRGTPVVAIHGTHERRREDHVNPVELLERMGFLKHLHGDHITFEDRDGDRVAVHGMSGVPERYAPDVLDRLEFSPVPEAYNVLMLHQSIRNMVYTDEDRSALEIGMLPAGFDLIVDGHIHWHNLELRDGERPLVLPGSTITTQMNKIEAERPKGFLMVDTDEDSVEFIALEQTRDVVHETVDADGMTGSQVRDRVMEIAEEATDGQERRPLVRVVVEGRTDAEVSVAELRRSVEDDVIPSLTVDLDRPDPDDDHSVDISEESAASMGQTMLSEAVGFDVSDLFDQLAGSDTDEALAVLKEMDLEELRGGSGEDAPGADAEQEDADAEDAGTDADPGTDGSATTDAGTDETTGTADEGEDGNEPTIRRFTELGDG